MILCSQAHPKNSQHLSPHSFLITNRSHLVTHIAIYYKVCQTDYGTGLVASALQSLSEFEVCIINYFYNKIFWVLAQKPHPLSYNCPKWNVKLTEAWIRAISFSQCWKQETGSEWSGEWWACWLECLWKTLWLLSLLCSKAQDYPKTASSTNPICSQRERLSLCIKKGLM